MKLDILSLLGTDFSVNRQMLKKAWSKPSVLVGWVDSYNEENGTVNILPAIQSEVVDENAVATYQNKPFLNNCWIISNTLTRNPQRGDKALVLVLDEKSNSFFKATYDNTKPLQEQTFVNSSSSRKSLSNCVAIIINPNHITTE